MPRRCRRCGLTRPQYLYFRIPIKVSYFLRLTVIIIGQGETTTTERHINGHTAVSDYRVRTLQLCKLETSAGRNPLGCKIRHFYRSLASPGDVRAHLRGAAVSKLMDSYRGQEPPATPSAAGQRGEPGQRSEALPSAPKTPPLRTAAATDHTSDPPPLKPSCTRGRWTHGSVHHAVYRLRATALILHV